MSNDNKICFYCHQVIKHAFCGNEDIHSEYLYEYDSFCPFCTTLLRNESDNDDDDNNDDDEEKEIHIHCQCGQYYPVQRDLKVHKCPSCHNEYVQETHCTWCGKKLHSPSLTTLCEQCDKE